jgi:ABC-type polysaccharide/polyol phosphate transport system ATPase subunit
MSSDLVTVHAQDLGKTYTLFRHPLKRLGRALFGAAAGGGQTFVALKEVSFELRRGEVLGLVGRNGAGKSTLLQLVCGTVQPSRGQVRIQGRVAALLELGAGFNLDFSGRENVFLNGTVLGLTRAEIVQRFDDIVAFSGLEDFIDQPVKTYSSGMLVRLAFSIATSVEPDVLVVDEALSVGDGAFARKSFDRIMALRDRGTTILFCSHSLFQVESICTRAIWLERGAVQVDGSPADVVSAYQGFLDRLDSGPVHSVSPAAVVASPAGHARLLSVRLIGDLPPSDRAVVLRSAHDDLCVSARFVSDPNLPAPAMAVTVHTEDARIVTSAGTWNDAVETERDSHGRGIVQLHFPALALLKGRYYVSVHLFCERGLHLYDVADRAAWIKVEQQGIEQGVVTLPHSWEVHAHTAPDDPSPSDPEDAAPMVDLLDDVARTTQELDVGDWVPAQALQRWATHTAHWHALAERFGLTPGEGNQWHKHREMRWTLRWVLRSEQADWARLFEAAFGYAMPDSLWSWKYAHAEALGVAAHTTQGMVAFYGGMPRPILYLGQSALAVQVGDVMVHPSERGVLTRRGPFQMAAATFLEQCIGTDKPYLLGFGFPETKAMQLAEKLGLYAAVDQISEVSWSAAQKWPHWRVSARALTPADADTVNRLWTAMAAAMKDNIIGVRDWAFVQHRYLQHPTVRYAVMLARDRWTQKPLGVVVLRDRDGLGLELMDLIGTPDHFTSLVGVARRYAARLGRSRVLAWITRSQQERLAGLDGRCEPQNVFVPTSVWSPGPPVDDIRGRWWLMGGDTDFR